MHLQTLYQRFKRVPGSTIFSQVIRFYFLDHYHLSRSIYDFSEKDTLEIPPSMKNWEEDDVRKWLLHIGLPGPLVSRFYAARVVGNKLARFSDEDLLRDFQLSKNDRELILCSRDGWLKQTTDMDERDVEIVHDLQSSCTSYTSVTRNDAWVDTDDSKIRFGDDISEYTSNVGEYKTHLCLGQGLGVPVQLKKFQNVFRGFGIFQK